MTLLLFAVLCMTATAIAQHQDATYPSRIFAESRNYRIFLPKDYQSSSKHYGVIYYFHGHSDRYTLEHYDKGQDTVPKIESFVAAHDVIVVAPDGFDAKQYTGFYGGTPYDVRKEGGERDYAEAFLELVSHIDAKYRTLPTRRYRGTSGLSMGGFMSLWISARYPEFIGSASAFNPGPEFYLGERGRRSLWRPKDHVALHESTPVRLVRASGDYISQYHEETRAAYVRTPTVDFEYRQDEYHRHWATSIAETFDFHLRAFADPKTDRMADRWTYTSPYRNFIIRGYEVNTRQLDSAAFVSLEDVTAGSFRLRTHRWAPDGPPAACEGIEVRTASLYTPDKAYNVSSFALDEGARTRQQIVAQKDGRLVLQAPCVGRQFVIGEDFNGLIVLPPQQRQSRHFLAGELTELTIRILNPSGLTNLTAELSSGYPTVQVQKTVQPVSAGHTSLLRFPVIFNASSLEWAHARLNLKISDRTYPIDVQIGPDGLTSPLEMRILDGRTETFTVFRQKGNQGGGGPMNRTVTEGVGNGDGVLQPGEKATIWLKYAAGIDGLDRGNWCRAKVYAGSPWMSEIEDIQEQKQLEWTSAMNRTSLVTLDPATPKDAVIPMVLDCESWTYYFTPDVRYGSEPLYQAFQFHRHHLFRTQWSGITNVP